MDAGIDVSAIESSVLESCPRWWRNYCEWYFSKRNILRYASGWNKLVSVSWAFGRIDGRKFESVLGEELSLVKLTNDSLRIGMWVKDNFSMGRYLEVVNKPRVGKSTGVLYGLFKLLLEDERFAGLGNYSIFIVAPNKRLAVNLYRYLVGLWNSCGNYLVKYGRINERSSIDSRIKVSFQLFNRGDLAKRIKVRLYLGGKDSCLLGKDKHFVESDCVKCPHFKLGKFPYHLPVLDPWMLKLSGYCPFSVSRQKGFLYNSIIVCTWDSFVKYFFPMVIRYKINKVVLVLDEFLELYERSRSIVKEVKIEDWMPVEVRDLVYEWNSLVRYLYNNIKRYYTEFMKWYQRKVGGGGDPFNHVRSILLTLSDNLKVVEEVKNVYQKMEDVVLRLAEIRLSSRVDNVKLRRIAREMELMLGWVWFVYRNGKSIDKLILRFNEKGYLVGGPSGQLRLILEKWRKAGIVYGVIGTSVLPTKISGLGEFILPHESLLPARSEINPVLKSVYMNLAGADYRLRSMVVGRWIDDLLSRGGVHIVVVDKSCVLSLIKELDKRYVVEVVGDKDRKVIDYVVVRDQNSGGEVYLLYPHGRVGMGVDPPVKVVDTVFIMGGVRRPPRWKIPLGAVDVLEMFNFGSSEVGRWYLRYFSKKGRTLSLRDEFNPGVVQVGRNITMVYDVWDWWYDSHVLRQIIGRWFLCEIRMLIYALKYSEYVPYSGYIYRGLVKDKDSKFVVKQEVVREYPLIGRMKVIEYVSADYRLEFYDPLFNAYKIIRGLFRKERSLYESLRLIRRSKPKDMSWVRRKIREVLTYIVYSDNPYRLKWLKRIYEEKGFNVAYKELLKYLGLEDYESEVKISTRYVKTFTV